MSRFLKSIFKGNVESLTEAVETGLANNASKGAILNQKTDTVAFLNPEKIQTVTPHKPMIKFGRRLVSEFESIQEAVSSLAQTSVASTPTPTLDMQSVTPGATLEWYQLPARYRRQPIDEAECEVINMGGPEKPWH